PQVGKTTVFNALSRGHADTAARGAEPNVGVVKVPDPRLDRLTDLYRPKKITPAEVTYIDVAAAPSGGFGKGQGISGPFLNALARTDALIHVVRMFDNPAVSHIEGSVDAERDIASMSLELAFSDLAILERRVDRITASMKAAKAQEREAAQHELELLARIKADLEREIPLRQQDLTDDERRSLEGYQFLTAKPLLLLLNLDEAQLADQAAIEARFSEKFAQPGTGVAAICGTLEAELAQMTPDEAAEFRAEMGLPESSLDRAIRISYELLGLVSFLTAGPDEVRAWTIQRNTLAPRAAGKIHTDIERGFIRAEVVRFDDLMAAGSMGEARKRGALRSEGRAYVMQDGDVVEFLFNVSKK
ncbi:MAG: redox-regulated ATPase YchF, partial [Chloroflexi bacterium]|nr:redox-regulated ATPase YchF [Chloroflexota bacterium]